MLLPSLSQPALHFCMLLNQMTNSLSNISSAKLSHACPSSAALNSISLTTQSWNESQIRAGMKHAPLQALLTVYSQICNMHSYFKGGEVFAAGVLLDLLQGMNVVQVDDCQALMSFSSQDVCQTQKLSYTHSSYLQHFVEEHHVGACQQCSPQPAYQYQQKH